MNPARAVIELPVGWAQGRMAEKAMIHCGGAARDVAGALAAFFLETSSSLVPWLELQFAGRAHPFERAVIDGELELLKEFSARHNRTSLNGLQPALL